MFSSRSSRTCSLHPESRSHIYALLKIQPYTLVSPYGVQLYVVSLPSAIESGTILLYIWKSIQTYLFFPFGIEISHMLPSIMESGYMLVLRSSPNFFNFFNLIPFEVVPCLSFLSRDELFYLAPLRKFRVEACKFGRKNVELFLPLTLLLPQKLESQSQGVALELFIFIFQKKKKREVEAEANVTHGANPLTPFLSHRNIMEPMELNTCFREPGLAPLPPYQTIFEQVMG